MMKTIRDILIFLMCLSAGALAGWLIVRAGYNPHRPASFNTANSNSISAAEAAAHSTLMQKSSSKPMAESLQAEAVLRQEIVDPAVADSGNPDKSEDWDQNRNWARKYPAEALKWLENAPDGPHRETMAEIVCPELAQTDPARAVFLAEQCNSSGTNFMTALRDGLEQQWAERDMQAATAWALAKPEGEDRDRLLGRIALVKSKNNPEEAAQWVAGQMSSGTVQDETAISVLYQWALRDAPAAMAWAQSFSESNIRYRAILEVQNVQAANNRMNQTGGN